MTRHILPPHLLKRGIEKSQVLDGSPFSVCCIEAVSIRTLSGNGIFGYRLGPHHFSFGAT
jgi:hypothetical protein